MGNTKYILLLLFLFFSIIAFHTTVNARDDIKIYCYTGTSPEYEYIGTVEVFNLSVATSTCNNVYYNCNGECFGCYVNPESVELCIDKNGNQFQKE